MESAFTGQGTTYGKCGVLGNRSSSKGVRQEIRSGIWNPQVSVTRDAHIAILLA